MQLLQTSDQMSILGGHEDFKRKKIGISNDLTPQQREMVAQARSEGKRGYFEGSQFFTKTILMNTKSKTTNVDNARNQEREYKH